MQFHFVRLIDLINNFIRDHLSIHTHVYFANVNTTRWWIAKSQCLVPSASRLNTGLNRKPAVQMNVAYQYWSTDLRHRLTYPKSSCHLLTCWGGRTPSCWFSSASAQGLQEKTNKQTNKHGVDTVIMLFARSPRYLCYFYP